jgi:hypothetical protein
VDPNTSKGENCCALYLFYQEIYDETIQSFQWLFETFFEALLGKKLNTIFIDQDPAMAKVISLVMLDTYYQLCTCHLMQNALGEKFSVVLK